MEKIVAGGGFARCGLIALFSLALFSGCGGSDLVGNSNLALRVGGGEALRVGFPHKEGGTTHAFVDGWTAKFTRFNVVLGKVVLTDPVTQVEVKRWDKMVVLDLMASASKSTDQAIGSEVLTTLSDLPARRLDFGFELSKATEQTENRSGRAEDVQQMIKNGWSTYIEGEASKAGKTIKFKLGFQLNLRYEECINGKDRTKGIALENKKTTGAFLYTHAIHLFWDTLGSGEEKVRFDAWAAVAGPDNIVTSDELKKQNLTDLKDAEGKPLKSNGKPVFYDDGGLLSPETQTLLDFVRYGVRESIHFNGLGLCKAKFLK